MRDIPPNQTWKADRFRPEDAEGIADLFLGTYGPDYPVRVYLEPARLTEENAAGRILSSVARTMAGDIIGHDALFRGAPYPGIMEMAAGVVHPAYRGGKGLGTALLEHGIHVLAPEHDIDGIYGEPVCNHVYMQKICHSLGVVITGLEPALMPGQIYDTNQDTGERVTTFFGYWLVKERPHRVFVPVSSEAFLRFVYGGLKEERQVDLSKEALPTHKTSRITGAFFSSARVARITVHEAGGDFAAAFAREEEGPMASDCFVLQAFLNLGEPWVGEAVRILRERGYFVAGILPRWFDEDGLLMERLLIRPDWDAIRIAFDRDRQIAAFVRAEYEESLRRGHPEA